MGRVLLRFHHALALGKSVHFLILQNRLMTVQPVFFFQDGGVLLQTCSGLLAELLPKHPSFGNDPATTPQQPEENLYYFVKVLNSMTITLTKFE